MTEGKNLPTAASVLRAMSFFASKDDSCPVLENVCIRKQEDGTYAAYATDSYVCGKCPIEDVFVGDDKPDEYQIPASICAALKTSDVFIRVKGDMLAVAKLPGEDWVTYTVPERIQDLTYPKCDNLFNEYIDYQGEPFCLSSECLGKLLKGAAALSKGYGKAVGKWQNIVFEPGGERRPETLRYKDLKAIIMPVRM